MKPRSVDSWGKLEQLMVRMAQVFLQRGVPQEPCATAAVDEHNADAWTESWIQTTHVPLPEDPKVLRVMLARFRYAAAAAGSLQLGGHPFPRGKEAKVFRTLLIEMWYEIHRAKWMAGERGTSPSEN